MSTVRTGGGALGAVGSQPVALANPNINTRAIRIDDNLMHRLEPSSASSARGTTPLKLSLEDSREHHTPDGERHSDTADQHVDGLCSAVTLPGLFGGCPVGNEAH